MNHIPPVPEVTRGSRSVATIAADARVWDEHLNAIPLAVWAWFSGWTSADGSIKAKDATKRPCIRFVITDRDPLIRFAYLFGGSIVGPIPPSGLGKKDRWEWQISGWRAHAMFHHMRPWLSDRYVERVDALASWSPRTDAGQKLNAADVAEIKARLIAGERGTALAREFGVSSGLICAIKQGRTWADVAPAARNGEAA